MINFFTNLFGTDFMPHVYCLQSPLLVWMHALSDAAIALAYFLIPIGLIRLVHKRRDLAFHWLFFLFALFILSCGATHVLSIVTLWIPVYRFDALIKFITAAASLLTAGLLFRLIPAISALPSPEQWRVANEELKNEINRRNTAEAAMRSLNTDLERRVEDRTRELEKQNIQLQDLNAAWDLSHGLIRRMEGPITFWCEGSEQLYGWKKEEATGKISHQLLQTSFPKPLLEIEQELSEKGTWAGELVHTTKGGARLQIATHWILRRNAGGAIASVIEVNNDITDRLRADEAMRRLADIVESSKDAIIGSSLDGRVTSWNPSAEALFGYSAAEMIGQSVHRLTPSDLLEEELSIFQEAGKTDGMKRYETVRQAKTGRSIDVSMTVSPIRDSSGKTIGTSMISQDISESKAQKEAIRVSEERQRLAVDAGQIGLWYVDVESGRRIFTQRFKELHGIREDEIVPDYPSPLTVIHEEDRQGVIEAFELMFQGGADLSVEYRTRGLDFRPKWVQCRGKAQLDASGKVKGIHGTVVDLTARREMEEKLRRMNTELEQFAYAAAHDLQEPLRNVALAAQLLKRNGATGVLTGDKTEQQPPLLNLMLENALRMEAMVKDLLAYSRALEGEEDPLAVVDGNHVLEAALQNLSAAIAEKAVTITKDLIPRVSMAEPHLLQLFQNLLSNALKYAARSPLKIHVGAQVRAGDILLFVKDNGVGISPQFHERAFGMFKRLDREAATGTGIGLAVCKRIVEHYGGHIWIESQVGQGATFFFTVPCVSGN